MILRVIVSITLPYLRNQVVIPITAGVSHGSGTRR